jgi:hypothetical protein
VSNFTRSDEVWTQDEKLLGRPHRLFRRTNEINPALRRYAAYLRVVSFEIGVFYVPTDFIAGHANGRIGLTVSMRTVQKRTWNRLPNFIVQGEFESEDVPGDFFEAKAEGK